MTVNPSVQPRISVVTPSYNQAQFLEATLTSVLGQGYPNLEYIVIDGSSTDGSADIIRRHEADLTYWVSEPDEGHAHALNKGFAHTSGDIMCWINSSDMYYPWTLATVAEIFSQLPQVEWLTGVGSQFDPQGRPRVVSVAPGMNIYDVLAGDYRWIQQESVFWRRSLWERAGGGLDESLRCAGDFDLWLRFFRCTPLYRAATLLAGFRVHDDRLGETADGQYEREATAVQARFVADSERRLRARGMLIRALRPHGIRDIADSLGKTPVLPWYKHPRVLYDFSRGAWTLR